MYMCAGNSFAIRVGENLILETDRVKHLTIILQSNMAWNLHILFKM